jgi:adenine-specific DNA-methyltransferase
MGRVKGEEGNEPWDEWEIPREAGERWPAKAVVAHQRIIARRRELVAVTKVLESVELRQHVQTVSDQAATDSAQELRAINELVGESYTFESLPAEPREPWPEEAKRLHSEWWEQRIARQKEIDASIAAKADFEYLYDKPYDDKSKVRVAGPFTVESLSPHRVLAVDEDDELIDHRNPTRERGPGDGESSLKRRVEIDGNSDGQYAVVAEQQTGYTSSTEDFASMILENLKTSGVQQAHKEDKVAFTSITGWPGNYICAEGRYVEGESEQERKAAVLIGPEFGTVARADLVAAAREAGEAGFDVLVACAFNFDAHSTDFNKLGPLPILKARMNADLHMADNLKNTGKGNLFVIFGEPDIDILDAAETVTRRVSEESKAKKGVLAKGDLADASGCDLSGKIIVKINGVDVFKPQSGDVVSDNADGIACWFLDTDYNEESFFVRHAYFLGANDPYKSLKTTLKAEINQEAWSSLHSDTSRPFDKPKSGRIAVKVINHLGDEVMKVFRVE